MSAPSAITTSRATARTSASSARSCLRRRHLDQPNNAVGTASSASRTAPGKPPPVRTLPVGNGAPVPHLPNPPDEVCKHEGRAAAALGKGALRVGIDVDRRGAQRLRRLIDPTGRDLGARRCRNHEPAHA